MTVPQILAATDSDPAPKGKERPRKKYAQPIRGRADVEALWARQQARQAGNAIRG